MRSSKNMSEKLELTINTGDTVPLSLYNELRDECIRLKNSLCDRNNNIDELNEVIGQLQDDINNENQSVNILVSSPT